MKKVSKKLMIALVISLIYILVGCSNSQQADLEPNGNESIIEPEVIDEKIELKTIRIGASPNVVDAVTAMYDSLEKEGIKLEVIPFDDIVQPNIALEEGQIDGNFYQHRPYMESYNQDNNTNFYFVKPLMGSFTGIYSEKWDKLSDIPNDSKIGIYRDSTNQHRALKLGEEEGLFTLKDIEDGNLYTILDLKDNPKNIELIPLDGASLINGLNDLDAIYQASTSMFKAGKDPKNYLATEKDNREFGIGLVIKDENKDSEWVDKFIKAFSTDDTKNKINDIYKGSFVIFE